MKKTLAILLAAMFVLSAFSLCACGAPADNAKNEETKTWENTAKDKDEVTELFDKFTEGTYKNTNQIVTAKSGGEEIFTETIDGDKDFISYKNGSQTYSFVDGDDKVYAMVDEGSGIYWVDETYYNYGYFAYKTYIELFKNLTDEEGVTFDCKVSGESKGDEKTETITLDVKNGDEGSMTVNATAKNGLIEKYSISIIEEDSTRDMEFTFAYGSASVTIPDTSEWSEQTVID